jgi:polar amino acid transport system substrate-binding protein
MRCPLTVRFICLALLSATTGTVVDGQHELILASVVAVQAGTKYEEYLKALKSKIVFTLQSYPGDTDAVAQVLLGRADAVLTQDSSFAYQAKQHPGKIAIGFTFGASDQFGIYYRKADASSIGTQISDGVAELRSNGTLKKLATKYKIPVNTVK